MVVSYPYDCFCSLPSCVIITVLFPFVSSIACGIIARSAGLFQNTKTVCACTGKTLWEERLEAKQLFKDFT